MNKSCLATPAFPLACAVGGCTHRTPQACSEKQNGVPKPRARGTARQQSHCSSAPRRRQSTQLLEHTDSLRNRFNYVASQPSTAHNTHTHKKKREKNKSSSTRALYEHRAVHWISPWLSPFQAAAFHRAPPGPGLPAGLPCLPFRLVFTSPRGIWAPSEAGRSCPDPAG